MTQISIAALRHDPDGSDLTIGFGSSTHIQIADEGGSRVWIHLDQVEELVQVVQFLKLSGTRHLHEQMAAGKARQKVRRPA